MRIAIAVHTYYPDRNGVQAVTQYIAEGLAQNNQVMVITEKKGGQADEETVNHVQIKRINIKVKGYYFHGEKEKYYEYLKEWKPDIFICVCTQTWTYDWIPNKLDKLPGKKVLYTHGYSGLLEHYPILSDLLHLKLRAFIYHLHWKIYYGRAYKKIAGFDLVTYLSFNNNAFKYAKKYKLANGIIMENAVEDRFFQSPVLQKDKNDAIYYIYVANYDDNKNHKMVLDAFYNTDMPNARLVLAGNGEKEYYNGLEEIRQEYERKYGSKHIKLIYGQSRKETYNLYDNADVFVCGSRKEQFPIMLCEAAAKGMAIISTSVGHAPIMPGIIIAYTQEDMQKAMQRLYDNCKERSERGKKLREYALRHYRMQDKISFFEKELRKL